MQVVLLRVGIDSGSGGMQGPLFEDGSFEFIPIDDGGRDDQQTYGNTAGVHGRMFIDYFPDRLKTKNREQSIHADPEFITFTYGDPTKLKKGLLKLEPSSLLVFYAGLQRWPSGSELGLYIVGYFVVSKSGLAKSFSAEELQNDFGMNFHFRHRNVFERQRDVLVLIKGGKGSRLLKKAKLISSMEKDSMGRPLKVVSPEMRHIFGPFGGRESLQRSPPRWVKAAFVQRASEFVTSLT